VQPIIDLIKKCPECGSENLSYIEKTGELVCNDCGLVIEENIIDSRPEWRSFEDDKEKDRSRVGPPVSLRIHDKGLHTTFSLRDLSKLDQSISPKRRGEIIKMHRLQRMMRVSGSGERNLVYALSELDRIASALSLPTNVREEAARLYRMVVEQKAGRGRRIEEIVAACVYATCRKMKISRTLDEIAAVTNLKTRDIGKTYRLIAKKMGMKMSPSNPSEYILRFSSDLKLSEEATTLAMEIAKEAEKKQIAMSRKPQGVAAAAIYLASEIKGEAKTQSEIARVARVTEVTIRHVLKELVDKLDMVKEYMKREEERKMRAKRIEESKEIEAIVKSTP